MATFFCLCLANRTTTPRIVLALIAILSNAVLVRAQMTAEALVEGVKLNESECDQITNAVARFRAMDAHGCRAILDCLVRDNPSLPPTGLMMAQLWLSTVEDVGSPETLQLRLRAIEEWEDAVLEAPSDPAAYVDLAGFALVEGRNVEASLHLEKASGLLALMKDNPARKRSLAIRCSALAAYIAEQRQQWDEACGHLNAWIVLDPENDNPRQRRAKAIAQADRGRKPPEPTGTVNTQATNSRPTNTNQSAEQSPTLSGKPVVAAHQIAQRDAHVAAIRRVMQQLNDAWQKTNAEAKKHTLPPPRVWQAGMARFVAIKTADCPADFQEAWGDYLVGCKELCDMKAYAGDPAALLFAPFKAPLTGGASVVEDFNRVQNAQKRYSDSYLRLQLVVKRYGIE